MTRAFDVDDDGYLDMDRFSDADPEDAGVSVVFEPPPPLPDSDWLAALSQAVNAPDDTAAADLVDVDDDAGPVDLDPSGFSVDGAGAAGHDVLTADDRSADGWPGSGNDPDGPDPADGTDDVAPDGPVGGDPADGW